MQKNSLKTKATAGLTITGLIAAGAGTALLAMPAVAGNPEGSLGISVDVQHVDGETEAWIGDTLEITVSIFNDPETGGQTFSNIRKPFGDTWKLADGATDYTTLEPGEYSSDDPLEFLTSTVVLDETHYDSRDASFLPVFTDYLSYDLENGESISSSLSWEFDAVDQPFSLTYTNEVTSDVNNDGLVDPGDVVSRTYEIVDNNGDLVTDAYISHDGEERSNPYTIDITATMTDVYNDNYYHSFFDRDLVTGYVNSDEYGLIPVHPEHPNSPGFTFGEVEEIDNTDVNHFIEITPVLENGGTVATVDDEVTFEYRILADNVDLLNARFDVSNKNYYRDDYRDIYVHGDYNDDAPLHTEVYTVVEEDLEKEFLGLPEFKDENGDTVSIVSAFNSPFDYDAVLGGTVPDASMLTNDIELSGEVPGDDDETPGDGNENPGDDDEVPGDGNENPGDGNEVPGDGDETPVTVFDPKETDLTEEYRGLITAPDAVVAGSRLILTVNDETHKNNELQFVMFSEPVIFAPESPNEDGLFVLSISPEFEVGDHKVAAYTMDGELVGWDDVSVLSNEIPSDGKTPTNNNVNELSGTGFEDSSLITVAIALLVTGGLLITGGRVVARNRK